MTARRLLRLLAAVALVCALALAMAAGGRRAVAEPLGTSIPAHCRAHTSFSGGGDLPDDYRCAGLALDFHVWGPASSPFPIWAGQWLFVDEGGRFRIGSCTFNRGIHPSIAAPSAPVGQAFANDPTGAKSAYLTWRYGDTTDDLTAAALWAVFHYYAQDAAGTNRNPNGTSPLIARLDRVGEQSGRDDVEAAALRLDSEAARFAEPFALDLSWGPGGVLWAAVRSGAHGVPGVAILLSNGSTITTGDDGIVGYALSLPAGRSTITAAAVRPGAAVVYRGRPAGSDPHGAQTLITGGAGGVVTAQISVDIPFPTTTTVATTTPPPPTSTSTSTSTSTTTMPPPPPPPTTSTPTTTSTLPPTTSSTTSSTTTSTTSTTSTSTTSTTSTTTVAPSTTSTIATVVAPTTTTAATTSTTVVPVTTTTLGPEVATPLPRTGGGDGSQSRVAYVGVALVVAGAGLVDAVRRRGRVADP